MDKLRYNKKLLLASTIILSSAFFYNSVKADETEMFNTSEITSNYNTLNNNANKIQDTSILNENFSQEQSRNVLENYDDVSNDTSMEISNINYDNKTSNDTLPEANIININSNLDDDDHDHDHEDNDELSYTSNTSNITTDNSGIIETSKENYINNNYTKNEIDEVFKSADSYKYKTPFSIDESKSNIPSEQVIIDKDKLFSTDAYYEITSNNQSIRDKAQTSVGTVNVGSYGGTIDTVNLYKGSKYFGNWSSYDRMYRYFTNMSAIAAQNYSEDLAKNDDYKKTSQIRKAVPTYLYADFKADYLRLTNEYETADKTTEISNLVTLANELYDAYTRKYNNWMGYSTPIKIFYRDNTKGTPEVEHVKSVVNKSLSKLPTELTQYLGTITYYSQQDSRYGYTYSTDGRIYLNVYYLSKASDNQITHTLTHETGHIVDGTGFVRHGTNDIQSITTFSRVDDFKSISNKHFDSVQIWEDFANTIADYYSYKVGYIPYFKDKLNDEIKYVDSYVRPYMSKLKYTDLGISKSKQYVGAKTITYSTLKTKVAVKFNIKTWIIKNIAKYQKPQIKIPLILPNN